MEPELNLLRRFVFRLLPFPILYCALSRLHQQRISTFDLHGLNAPIGQHERFQFHRSAKVHAARNGRISRHNLIDHLPVARRLFILRGRNTDLERESKDRQKYQDSRGTSHNVYTVNITAGRGKLLR